MLRGVGMSKSLCFALIVAVVSGQVRADEVMALRHADGSLRVVTLHSAGGQTTITIPRGRVFSVTGGAPDDPRRPDDPNPGSTITDVVKTALASVSDTDKDTNAKKIAAIYETVAKEVRNGTFKNTSEIAPAVKRLTDMILDRTALKRWESFRTILGEELTRLGKLGKLADSAAIAKTFDEIANALKSQSGKLSAESEKSIMSVLLLIIKLLPLILEIIRGFSP